MKIIKGIIIALMITYFFGALVAWDINPAHWHWVWRLLVVMFAIFLSIVGGCLGWVSENVDDDDT